MCLSLGAILDDTITLRRYEDVFLSTVDLLVVAVAASLASGDWWWWWWHEHTQCYHRERSSHATGTAALWPGFFFVCVRNE